MNIKEIQNIKICETLKKIYPDKPDKDLLYTYNVCLKLRQQFMRETGEIFENFIENILMKYNIKYSKQINIDEKGIIGTKCAHRIDFVIGDIEKEKNIRNLIVLSAKKTCRERWRQDDWSLSIPPKKFLLLTLSDDYPKSKRFNESETRKIITSKKSKNDDRIYKLSFNDLPSEIGFEEIKKIKFIDNKVKFIDLFCGIGSFHYSLSKVGFECVMACDIFKPAVITYEKNYGIKPLGDIIDIEPDKIPKFNIICAGFPCQPFSNIGKHKGMKDDRGMLFYQIMKFVHYHKPEIILLENVPALLKHDSGNTFLKIKNEIIKGNYDVEYSILKCSDYGIPQNRKRLFIVGTRSDLKINNILKFEKIRTKTLSHFLGKNFNKDIAYTIRCGGKRSPINDKHNWDGYFVDGKEYRLTIEDCLKLQGFENFELCGSKNEQYKLVGNTIPTNFTKLIAEKIKNIVI